MPTILTLKQSPPVPLEAEVLSPDVVAPLSHDEVRALPVFLGKRQCRVDEFFDVEGAGSENLEVSGDAARVKWIGRGMTRGSVTGGWAWRHHRKWLRQEVAHDAQHEAKAPQRARPAA